MITLWHRLAAAFYDRLLASFEQKWLRQKRCELLRWSQGRVLEIGGGTGANLPCYSASTRVVLSEPDRPMLAKARLKLREARLSADLLLCRAEDLPFQSQSFDTVVSTLVLCSVSDPSRSLREIARVLKRGGRFLFLEHTRAEKSTAAKWQDRLTPLWSRLALGCHLNRTTVASIQQAGFHIARLERHLPPGLPRLAQPAFLGVALNQSTHPLDREGLDRFDNIGAQGGPR